MKNYSLYIIPPLLCLITGYSLAIISIIWGKVKKESILLALTCFWWTLLSYAFIYHNIETDLDKILFVEKIVHTLYVFSPVISIIFFQVITDRINKLLIALCTALSLGLALLVHTPLYFQGFNAYQWGIIAKGSGPALRVFALYGFLTTLYIVYLFIKKIRVEKNHFVRLKIYYLFTAYFLSAVFTFTNAPAMYGIDFYPFSNFMFIPLGIMTYGVLKYRLVRISSVLHLSVFWLALSSMIAIPNMLIFILVKNNITRIGSFWLIILFLLWFFADYYYFNKIQPVINQLFNKTNYSLSRMEKIFIKDLAMLKNLDELVFQMITMLRKTLNIEKASLYIRRGYAGNFMDSRGNFLDTETGSEKILLEGAFFEKSLIESDEYTGSSAALIPLFNSSGSEYIIPLVHQRELIAILTLTEKINRKRLKEDEVRFICNLSSYATVALANSVMYQNLSDIKDNLERIVDDRTALIEKQKSYMESDIQLARKIQMALLPVNIPDIKELKVAYKYEPIMGVGGDFIDIHYRPGRTEFGLFICDVSGHGSSSAMIASMVKMSLNSWGKFLSRPAQAIAEIRNLLKGKIGDNFITAFMCCIDLTNGNIVSACAGHPPMIIIRQSGDIELVKPSGKILFDLIDSEYEEVHRTLKDGDKIVLYTDGVFETRNSSGKMIGEEMFIQMLSENSALSAEDLCQKIYDKIFTPAGNIIEDDFALLVAEYKN